MKLEYLYIDGYKGLKRLKLQFKEQTGVVPVDFLIGCDGSGKSSVLEAVGLIFTRIMQNELPGFIFELKYRMPDGTGIYVKPQKKGFCDASGRRRKLYVELEKNGKTQQLYSIPDEYLPDRIISYCSGANSSMEDILIRSPRASLASDLYDLSLAMDVENGEGPVSGIFIGTFLICLAETVKVLPILAHRVKLKKCLGFVVLFIAIGKMVGHLVYYLVP